MLADAQKENYEVIEIVDTFALFTNSRLDRSTVPEGTFAYDLRTDDDGCGDFCTIEEHVYVNHGGTIVTRVPIELPQGEKSKYRTINEEDYNFIGISLTFDEYMKYSIDDLKKLIPDNDLRQGYHGIDIFYAGAIAARVPDIIPLMETPIEENCISINGGVECEGTRNCNMKINLIIAGEHINFNISDTFVADIGKLSADNFYAFNRALKETLKTYFDPHQSEEPKPEEINFDIMCLWHTLLFAFRGLNSKLGFDPNYQIDNCDDNCLTILSRASHEYVGLKWSAGCKIDLEYHNDSMSEASYVTSIFVDYYKRYVRYKSTEDGQSMIKDDNLKEFVKTIEDLMYGLYERKSASPETVSQQNESTNVPEPEKENLSNVLYKNLIDIIDQWFSEISDSSFSVKRGSTPRTCVKHKIDKSTEIISIDKFGIVGTDEVAVIIVYEMYHDNESAPVRCAADKTYFHRSTATTPERIKSHGSTHGSLDKNVQNDQLRDLVTRLTACMDEFKF